MRDLSAVYKQSVSSDARNYTVHLNVWKKTVDDNGNVSFPENTKAVYTSSDSLISMSIIDGQTSGNSFQLGQTFCPIISFTTVPNLNIKTGDKVQVDLVFTSFVKATLATGYIDEYSYDSIDYAVSYTAYGKMIQLDKDYNSALTYPATFSAMVNEICSQNGLTFDTFDWKCNAKLKAKPIFGNLDNGEPAYASAREMLGIIAGVNGCNVIITADEKVKFVPYTDTKTGITYEDAFSRQVNNEKYVIKKAVLNDGGQTSGNEAGYVELYFPLETVEGKASCLEKLNSVITGLSVMGMTVQIQGRGYYEIGDMLSYTDFDGEKYTIGVMGIKYDFGGGYFTETLYSLAPSEMEEQYKGNVRYSSTSTTIKNPVVISENTSSYLGYQYHTIGYRKGDKITYGQDGSSNIIVQGYDAEPEKGDDFLGSPTGDITVHDGIYNSDTNTPVNFSVLTVYTKVSRVDENHYSDGTTLIVYNFNLWSEYTTPDGTTKKQYEFSNELQTKYGNFATAVKWDRIYAPSADYPYGRGRLNIGVNYCKYGSSDPEKMIWAGGFKADVSFSSIAEYNAAVQLSGEPLTMYDVTQDVMKIGEADEPTDLPTIGDVDTLYITYQPPACWKYSTITNKYYCVGRNYRELQRIKSSTEASNALEVFNVPIIFDCRAKTEWELEANTVYPKGFMIFEQNPESREITKLKIANGIDKLSDLKYTNVTEGELPTKTSQLENDSGFLTEIPIASNTVLGGVKISDDLIVGTDGKLSVGYVNNAQNIGGSVLDIDTLKMNTAAETGKRHSYYCPVASAQNITNRPLSSNEAFALEVQNIRRATDENFITLKKYTSTSQRKEFVRWCVNGTWGAWQATEIRTIYGTITSAEAKSYAYSTYGIGYARVKLTAMYTASNSSGNQVNIKQAMLTSSEDFERTMLNVNDTVFTFKVLAGGNVTLEVTGGSTSFSYELQYSVN